MTILTYKTRSGPVFCTPKAEKAVRRVLDRLRQGRRLRSLMTRGSQMNLLYLSYQHPTQTRAFLKNLLHLERLAVPIESVIIPQNITEAQNREVLDRLGELKFVFDLVGSSGKLDLRATKLKRKFGYVDLTPNHKPLTLEDYIKVLDESYLIFKRDVELGDLFLYKFILRARIDLYKAGERRSARKKRGEDIGITAELLRVKEHLDFLVDNFPFGTINERLYLREKIGLASHWLGQKNNTAANTTLVPVTDRLERTLDKLVSERLERTRRAKDPRRLKLNYNRGTWKVRQEGYKKTVVNLLSREDIDHGVSNAKLLSRIQHQIDSITEEITRNERFRTEIACILAHLPEKWDALFELYLTFAKYYDRHKEKACAEIEGALQLSAIGSDQAVNLARSLLNLAIRDIGLRQENLLSQKERLVQFYNHTENRMAKIMINFGEQISRELGSPDIIYKANKLENIDRRLRGFLGTFFKGEMREDWLKKAKRKVIGLRRALPKLKPLLREMSETKDVVSRQTVLKEIVEKLVLGAKHILGMELIYINRKDYQMCEDAFHQSYGVVLGRIRTLIIEKPRR